MSPLSISIYRRVGQYDPTRTLSLRNKFAAEMKRRFSAIQRLIVQAIVEQDCFGLNTTIGFSILQELTLPGRQAFAFPRSGDKVKAFMKWLGRQEDRGILSTAFALQPGEGVESAWTNTYIDSAYQQGIRRAREEMIANQKKSKKQVKRLIPTIEQSGGIAVAFNTPFHADRAGVLYTRVYSDLQGITNAMDQQISRVLSQGIIDGLGPRQIARNLTKVISGPSLGMTDALGRYIPAKVRAEMLARTEIIRAHNVATIQEYRNWGVVGVKVKAEWTTAGDGRVCEDCAAMEGKVFELDEIEGKIPLHPRCRCIALPVDVTEGRRQ